MKTCKSCGVQKELSEFSPKGKSKKGTMTYSAHCKDCRAMTARDERDKNKQRLTCSCCGSVFKYTAHNKRTENFCSSCYPLYRRAYSMLIQVKARSKKLNLPFNLTTDFIVNELKKGFCPKTGIEFTIDNNGKGWGNRKVSTPSVDKIDPSKGYTIDNVQIVCWWYNLAKATFTDQEVIELCKKVTQQYSLNT